MTMLLHDFLKDEYERVSFAFDVSELKSKTFLITGANGLIGSNLINVLYFLNIKHGLKIKVTGHSFSAPVAWLPKSQGFTYLSSDLAEGLKDMPFDFLIHTATYGQPKKFIRNKLETVRLNTETLINLLEMSRKNNAKVLFVSSSEVYGQIPAEIMPVTETYPGNVDTQSERAVYAESKRMAETICNIFSKNGLWVKIARLAIAYGPGVKFSDSRFMNEFIRRALKNGALTMMDAGNATRCFCFISDMIEMMLNTLLASRDTLYNLAGTDNKTIREVAEMISQNLNVPLYLPQQEESIGGTPAQLVLSNAKYCKEFNKQDFIPFENGLKKTIEWLELLNKEEEKMKKYPPPPLLRLIVVISNKTTKSFCPYRLS